MLLNNSTLQVHDVFSWYLVICSPINFLIITPDHSLFLMVQDIHYVCHCEIRRLLYPPIQNGLLFAFFKNEGKVLQEGRGENIIIMYKIINVKFMDKIRHLLNPLHIYCRLKYVGISQKVALGICKNYETFVYRRTIGKPC